MRTDRALGSNDKENASVRGTSFPSRISEKYKKNLLGIALVTGRVPAGSQVTERQGLQQSSWTEVGGALASGCGVRNKNSHGFLGKLYCLLLNQGIHIKF